jgi:hypothetical protein
MPPAPYEAGPQQPWAPPLRPSGPAQAWLPRPYAQLLRGPNHRWWRPLLGVATILGLVLVVLVVLVVGGVVAGLALGWFEPGGGQPQVQADVDDWVSTPVGLLVNNLILAALIPTAMVAVWLGHRWRPRWVASVVGGVRWRWLLHCVLVSSALFVPLTVAFAVLGGVPAVNPEKDAGWLLLVVLVSTPLQAAGEEYFFRGWLSQAVGSLIPRAGAATVVAAAVSSVAFATAHGTQDPWLFADRLAFGVFASVLAWRTGGLEAGIAVHVVNNVVIFVQTILLGGLNDAITSTSASPWAVLADIASLAVVTGLLEWRARRRRVERVFRPPTQPIAGAWLAVGR